MPVINALSSAYIVFIRLCPPILVIRPLNSFSYPYVGGLLLGNILDNSYSFFFFQIGKLYLSDQIDLCAVPLSNAFELSIRHSVFALPALVSFMVVIS